MAGTKFRNRFYRNMVGCSYEKQKRKSAGSRPDQHGNKLFSPDDLESEAKKQENR